MPAPFTLVNLTEVEDSAPKFGYGELQEARFAARVRRAACRLERKQVATAARDVDSGGVFYGFCAADGLAGAAAAAVACAVVLAAALDSASANRSDGAEFKKAAEKKTIKAVKKRLPVSNSPDLQPSRQPVKVKVTSCKQRLRGHSVGAFKCAWNAHGELPGRVLLRGNGKAKVVVKTKKFKRRGTKCTNIAEIQAPLVRTPHPVEFGYFEVQHDR